jgi:hypothetical protein
MLHKVRQLFDRNGKPLEEVLTLVASLRVRRLSQV